MASKQANALRQIAITKAKMKKLPVTYAQAAAAAIKQEANQIFNESQRQVPIETTTLKQNGDTSPPRGRLNPRVDIFYATKYALAVHERNAKHNRPTKWKYLSDPLKAAYRGYNKRIAGRIKNNVKHKIGSEVL